MKKTEFFCLCCYADTLLALHLKEEYAKTVDLISGSDICCLIQRLQVPEGKALSLLKK